MDQLTPDEVREAFRLMRLQQKAIGEKGTAFMDTDPDLDDPDVVDKFMDSMAISRETYAQWLVDLMRRLQDEDRPKMLETYLEHDHEFLETVWLSMCSWIARQYQRLDNAD